MIDVRLCLRLSDDVSCIADSTPVTPRREATGRHRQTAINTTTIGLTCAIVLPASARTTVLVVKIRHFDSDPDHHRDLDQPCENCDLEELAREALGLVVTQFRICWCKAWTKIRRP
jgi:hypothetical protein